VVAVFGGKQVTISTTVSVQLTPTPDSDLITGCAATFVQLDRSVFQDHTAIGSNQYGALLPSAGPLRTGHLARLWRRALQGLLLFYERKTLPRKHYLCPAIRLYGSNSIILLPLLRNWLQRVSSTQKTSGSKRPSPLLMTLPIGWVHRPGD
jgi:hypothetical protein